MTIRRRKYEKHWAKHAVYLAGSSILALAGTLIGAGTAMATSEEHAAAAMTSTEKFVAQSDVEREWRQAVANASITLPDGVSYPQRAPAFFSGEGGEIDVYQQSLFGHFVDSFARCAWLDARADANDDARQRNNRERAMSQFRATLPAPSLAEYDAHITSADELARIEGIEANEILLVADCSGLYERNVP